MKRTVFELTWIDGLGPVIWDNPAKLVDFHVVFVWQIGWFLAWLLF